jgi:hypothetical protein
MNTKNKVNGYVVTGDSAPAGPILEHVGDAEYPIYRGPLGVARLFVQRDRYLLEMETNGKFNVFLALDPGGAQCAEWSLSYESMEDALREALGVYFWRAGYDNDSLPPTLRALLMEELSHLT